MHGGGQKKGHNRGKVPGRVDPSISTMAELGLTKLEMKAKVGCVPRCACALGLTKRLIAAVGTSPDVPSDPATAVSVGAARRVFGEEAARH